MGLVGLLIVDRAAGPPRAAGMDGVIVGYVVWHPALDGPLTVKRGRHELPVLAFRLHLYVVQANGVGGVEEIRGRGKLEVFCDADGFNDEFLSNARAIEKGIEVEKDDIQFQGKLNTDTYRFYMSLNETEVASRAFKFDGRDRRTPTGRTSRDVLVGEFNDGFLGVAIASTTAMPPLSATQKLIALAGPPPNTPTRY